MASIETILRMAYDHLTDRLNKEPTEVNTTTAVNTRFIQLFSSQYGQRRQTFFEKFLSQYSEDGLHTLADILGEDTVAAIVAANLHRFNAIAMMLRGSQTRSQSLTIVDLAVLIPDHNIETAIFPEEKSQAETLLGTVFKHSDMRSILSFMSTLNYVSHRVTKTGYRKNLFEHQANEIDSLYMNITAPTELLGVKCFLSLLRIYVYLVNLQLEGGSVERIERSENDFTKLIDVMFSALLKKQHNPTVLLKDALARYIAANPLPQGTSLGTLTGGWLPSKVGGYSTQVGSQRHHDLREALKELSESALDIGLGYFRTFLEKRSSLDVQYRRSVPEFSIGNQGALKTTVLPAARQVSKTVGSLMSGGSGSSQASNNRDYKLYGTDGVQKLLSIREQALLQKIHRLLFSSRLTPVPQERSDSRASRVSGRSSVFSLH